MVQGHTWPLATNMKYNQVFLWFQLIFVTLVKPHSSLPIHISLHYFLAKFLKKLSIWIHFCFFAFYSLLNPLSSGSAPPPHHNPTEITLIKVFSIFQLKLLFFYPRLASPLCSIWHGCPLPPWNISFSWFLPICLPHHWPFLLSHFCYFPLLFPITEVWVHQSVPLVFFSVRIFSQMILSGHWF